ncbi:MAG: DUF2587 domain-containing protein, partial [Actinobacteria bacterium]|nr:DUF2587 domain-containing protein [Actinomycetota bacterium]
MRVADQPQQRNEAPQPGEAAGPAAVVEPENEAPADGEVVVAEAVQHPAKVMRIASMARQLLDEVRQAQL